MDRSISAGDCAGGRDLGGRDERAVAGGLGEVDDGAVGPQDLHEGLVLVAKREVVPGGRVDGGNEALDLTQA